MNGIYLYFVKNAFLVGRYWDFNNLKKKKKPNKKTNNNSMTNKPGQTTQRTWGELSLGQTRSGDNGCMYHCPSRMLYCGYRYFQLKNIPVIDALIHSILILRC